MSWNDFARELARLPKAAPIPTPDPGHCRLQIPQRVRAGDFITEYDVLVPQNQIREAIRRLQRSASTPPFCPYTNQYPIVLWRKCTGGVCAAHWLCVGCNNKTYGAMVYQMNPLWFGVDGPSHPRTI